MMNTRIAFRNIWRKLLCSGLLAVTFCILLCSIPIPIGIKKGNIPSWSGSEHRRWRAVATGRGSGTKNIKMFSLVHVLIKYLNTISVAQTKIR